MNRFQICLLVLALAPITAAADDAGKTFRRTTKGGQVVLLHQYANWDQFCRSTGDVIITLLSQPTGGTLEMRHEVKADAGIARVGSRPCLGTPIPAIGVYYAPKQDFKGTDTFRFEVRYSKGTVIDQAIVDVQ